MNHQRVQEQLCKMRALLTYYTKTQDKEDQYDEITYTIRTKWISTLTLKKLNLIH